MRHILLLIALLICPMVVSASDVSSPQSTLYPYRTIIELEDEFLTGVLSSGNIGQLGWTGSGTISAGTGSVSNHPGTFILDTGASSGTIGRINCNGQAQLTSTYPQSVTWIAKATQIDANTTIRIGAGNAFSSSPPNDGVYFERLDGDTNWFVVTRAASASSVRVDTGIVADTSWLRFRYEQTSASVLFYINDLLVGTQTDHIPSVYICPGLMIINSAAASKKMEIDFFSLRVTGIAR